MFKEENFVMSFNNKFKLSIIVPVYNATKYLNRCINSLVNQSIENIEIILVDDGSTDDSLSICREWALKDNRIVIVEQENSGVSTARNRGIEISNGEFVLLLDSDDWLALNTVEVLLKEQQRENADCVVFGFNQTSGNIWAPLEEKCYNTLFALKTDFPYWLNTELLSSSVNKLYKRQLIKKLYPKGMAFGEDLLFSLDYLEQCKCISFIKEPLYQHEVYNNTSLTHTFNINRFRDIETIQNRILEFAVEKNDKELYKKYVFDCIRIIRSFLQCGEKYKIKKRILNDWFQKSYFKELNLFDYELIWQNRLLLSMVQMRLYSLANILVNWKRIFKIS